MILETAGASGGGGGSVGAGADGWAGASVATGVAGEVGAQDARIILATATTANRTNKRRFIFELLFLI